MGDNRALARLVAGFDYPMVVVTAAEDGTGAPSGCLVGFSTQCAIDPARYLVCLSDKNHTYRVARTARLLAVHVLDAGRRDLAELFGAHTSDDMDKFVACDWTPGPDGVPLLTGCRRMVGRVLDRIDFGDHVGFVLDPVGGSDPAGAADPAGGGAGRPLMFSDVRGLEAGHEA